MADWYDELTQVRKRAGDVGPIKPEQILAAFRAAGMSDQDQANILAGFMDTHVTPTPTPVQPAPQVLSLTDMVQLMKDPTKHAELQAAWQSMDPAQKQAIINQIKSMEQKVAQVDPAYNTAVSTMRKLKPLATGTTVPDKIKNSILADIPKGQVNKDWSVNTANRINQLHTKGYQVQELHTAWMRVNIAGKRAQTIQEQVSHIP